MSVNDLTLIGDVSAQRCRPNLLVHADELDAKHAIAAENDAVAALLNGPRYWLMSGLGKRDRDGLETQSFRWPGDDQTSHGETVVHESVAVPTQPGEP